MVTAEHGCCFYFIISVWMLGLIVLLDNLPTTKTQLPGRGNLIFCQDCPWTIMTHYGCQINIKYSLNRKKEHSN